MNSARAALVSGGSSGIGLALARMLGEEGYALTLTARRAAELEPATRELVECGFDIQPVEADFAGPDCEAVVRDVVARHRRRFGRLDVLCNNAGASVGAGVADVTAKRLDVQINTNLRQIVFFYRECLDLLHAAAAEHRNANVINTSSVLGKSGGAWLSVYSATKHAIVGWTQAMNQELGAFGIKSCALCPDLVDTPMSRVFQGRVAPDSMIDTADIAQMARAVIGLSPRCVVPEIVFAPPDAAVRAGSLAGVGAELAHTQQAD